MYEYLGGECCVAGDLLSGGPSVLPQTAAQTPALSTPSGAALASESAGPTPATPAKLTGPTELDSVLGKMTVVPDDFMGPLQPGVVRQSEQQRMLTVYQHIASGQSQLTFDTSNIMAGKDLLTDPEGYRKAMAESDAFKAQYMGYLADLVKTKPGLELLSQLDSGKHKTTIQRASAYRNETEALDPTNHLLRPDGTPGAGSDTIVRMNPALKSYVSPAQTEEPWMTERDKFGFYHELVHAYHDGRGESAPGSHLSTGPGNYQRGLAELEFEAMGLGPYKDNVISDNAIRAAMGKAQRPNYGGYSY
ncbi:MAG TPA: M91 family zinc metallopeptidase [Pseudomonadota bacterium]|nr:M91 family zinc metallopeptidase [Pseudomonadota bacterium]